MKSWRESASIIMAAKNGLSCDQFYDYSILFLKRHMKSNAYANSFVFPGGVIEPADSDIKWIKFFKNYGYNDSNLKSLIPIAKNRPEIFCSKENELPREISLRICAIRETFEECGILLCKRGNAFSLNETDNFSILINEIEYWQSKVHSDANEFYNMCKEFNCLPNLWILHEWGNWLSPTFIPSKIRFNTAFFLTCLPTIPTSKLDHFEIEDLIWLTPKDSKQLKHSFPPPQQYELSRIEKYQNLDNLLEYALKNSKKGSQLMFPIKVDLLDGAVLLFPGDTMYPEKVSLHKLKIIDKSSMTIKEFREMSSNNHRLEYFFSKSKDTKPSKL